MGGTDTPVSSTPSPCPPALHVMRPRLPACFAAGFTKRAESVYDPFGAGHSSTSVSAALGMAVGRDFKGRKNNVIAVRAPPGCLPFTLPCLSPLFFCSGSLSSSVLAPPWAHVAWWWGGGV